MRASARAYSIEQGIEQTEYAVARGEVRVGRVGPLLGVTRGGAETGLDLRGDLEPAAGLGEQPAAYDSSRAMAPGDGCIPG
jgi:hypothetical protein